MNPAKTQVFSESFTFPVRKTRTKTDRLDSKPKNTTRQNGNKRVTGTTSGKLNETPKKKSNKGTSFKKPKAKSKALLQEANQRKPDTPATTKTDSKDHDRTSSQTFDRKEYRRLWGQNNRHEAKKNGLCTKCAEEPPIPGQTRCQECAEKHRRYREKAVKNPEAREKERIRAKQSRERKKGAEAAS